MGHYAYLDKSYRRLKEADIDEAYLKAMKNVSIYTAPKGRRKCIAVWLWWVYPLKTLLK